MMNLQKITTDIAKIDLEKEYAKLYKEALSFSKSMNEKGVYYAYYGITTGKIIRSWLCDILLDYLYDFPNEICLMAIPLPLAMPKPKVFLSTFELGIFEKQNSVMEKYDMDFLENWYSKTFGLEEWEKRLSQYCQDVVPGNFKMEKMQIQKRLETLAQKEESKRLKKLAICV